LGLEATCGGTTCVTKDVIAGDRNKSIPDSRPSPITLISIGFM
jgi:hypothetical protein